ncbi:alpha/beta hydrolase [Thioalkalivibrio paradoxus]|uniref:Lysophospholipase n=1 Tax=Thioalkalivibrio paradoxus ARh 1 TaxID=713585 RepID=W0DKH7_9GAMM|nr:alpha/beta hydrolase [Thioalkalivibrio paradoxus]AHE97390.1 lysophospholipase [Thioalkalivibrio paradoxus ARh 1]
MDRSLLSLALIVAVAYGVFVAFLYLTQERLIYFPVATLATTPERHGLAYEDVELAAEDGVRLHGWFVPAPEARATLLFFHGNGGNLSHRIDSLQIFHDLGLSAFILSYRGYGRSEGRPSETGTRLDANAAWRHLREERGVSASEIVVFGRSLGAAVGAELASRETPGAVILESPFTSAADLGAEVYPWLPVRLLLRHEYDVLGPAQAIRSPLLVVHSRDDEIVPFAHGRAISDVTGADLLELRGGHNDAFLRSRTRYVEGLRAFLDTAFAPRAQGLRAPAAEHRLVRLELRRLQ